MNKLIIHSDPLVEQKFKSYPKAIKKKLEYLRQLILETAEADGNIEEIEEFLKWGEPSFLVKKGSTIRIDWKSINPEQYAMYFKCTSKLIPSFKAVYKSTFKYENSRAILFDLEEDLAIDELKACIHAALNYHRLKSQDNLGLSN